MDAAIDTGDTAWMLDGDRAGAADDTGARPLLRRPRALEEHAQHVHDVRSPRSPSRRSPGPRSATRSPSTATGGFIGGLDHAFLQRRRASSRARGTTIPHLRLLRLPGDLLHHHHGPGLGRGGRADALRPVPGLQRRSGRCSSTRSSRTGPSAAAGCSRTAPSTSPAASRSRWRSGFSALAAALVVGARKDYGRQALLPHNAVYVLLGAGLLWFGWFGFNGGSGLLTGDRVSVLAFVNTLLCPGLRAGRRGSCSTCSAVAQGDRDRRGDGDHRRLRRHHPRRPATSAPAWAMALGVARRAAQLRDHRVAPAHAGRRDARRARRPRRRAGSPGSSSSASSRRSRWNGDRPTASSTATPAQLW